MSSLSVVDDASAETHAAPVERQEAVLALRSGAALTVTAIVLFAAGLGFNQIGPASQRIAVPASVWVVIAVAFALELGGGIVIELRRDWILTRAPGVLLDLVLWSSTCAMALSLAVGQVLIPGADTALAVMYVLLVVYAGFFYKRAYALTSIAWCVGAYLAGMVIAASRDPASPPVDLGSAVPVVGVMIMSGAFVAITRRVRERVEQRARLVATVGLARALDLRDPYTAEHSETVARYAAAMARELGLSTRTAERIHLAGLVHDVGKIGIPDAVLLKPAALNDAEWALMRRHPELGAQMLDSRALRDVRRWVLAHHERPDGTGYPAGLAGDDIPVEARILAVADAFEAMTADRVYRAGMPVADAVAELRRCAGTQFDPEVVDAFVATLGSGGASERDLAA